MEENSGKSQLESIIEKVDETMPSPAERAHAVQQALIVHDFSNWDCVCFAIEYLGALAPALPWLEEDVKKVLPAIRNINRLIYTQHYLFSQGVSSMEEAVKRYGEIKKEITEDDDSSVNKQKETRDFRDSMKRAKEDAVAGRTFDLTEYLKQHDPEAPDD